MNFMAQWSLKKTVRWNYLGPRLQAIGVLRWAILLLPIFSVMCASAAEEFEGTCPVCATHYTNSVESIKTNLVEPLMNLVYTNVLGTVITNISGQTNWHVDVTMLCPNKHTNTFGAIIWTAKPMAAHVKRTVLPHRTAEGARINIPPPLPGVPLRGTIVSNLFVPDGFRVSIEKMP